MPEDVLDYQESVLQMVNSLAKGGMPSRNKKNFRSTKAGAGMTTSWS
jgi:hypothetical protein